MTKYHKLGGGVGGGLSNRNLSQFWRLGVKIKVPVKQSFPLRPLLWCVGDCCLAVVVPAWGGTAFPLLIRTPVPSDQGPIFTTSFNRSYLLKTLSPVTLGIRNAFEGNANIRSIAWREEKETGREGERRKGKRRWRRARGTGAGPDAWCEQPGCDSTATLSSSFSLWVAHPHL